MSLDRIDHVVGVARGWVGLEGDGGSACTAASLRFSTGGSGLTALSASSAVAARRARLLAREGEGLGLGPGREYPGRGRLSWRLMWSS